MTAFEQLKALAEEPENEELGAMVEAIIQTIKLTIPTPASGFAVASAVYCTLLNDLMRDCLKPQDEAGVLSALHETTEQVRELIEELTLCAPELTKRAKERK